MINENRRKRLYLIFGGLSFCVNTGCYMLAISVMNPLKANVVSWVITVMFVYVTNRKWVFESREETAYGVVLEIMRFMVGRIGTLVAEEFILLFFITLLKCNEIIVKLVAQMTVIAMNYVISRQYVFKEKRN